jgi:galactoside 2-L-fucosyltransferase 1/2
LLFLQVKFVGIGEGGWLSYIGQSDKLPPSNIQIDGWLQHWRYFAHVDDQLRYDFTLPPDIIQQAQRILDAIGASSLRKQGYVRVVIHVRRGDYSTRIDGLIKRRPDFFKRALGYFNDCLPKVHFIVISDNSTWCRQNIFGRRVDFIECERSPAIDLAIASLCDHAIITVGTFGWWAAWFANGVTLELTENPGEAMRPPAKLKEW